MADVVEAALKALPEGSNTTVNVPVTAVIFFCLPRTTLFLKLFRSIFQTVSK